MDATEFVNFIQGINIVNRQYNPVDSGKNKVSWIVIHEYEKKLLRFKI